MRQHHCESLSVISNLMKKELEMTCFTILTKIKKMRDCAQFCSRETNHKLLVVLTKRINISKNKLSNITLPGLLFIQIQK